MTSIISTESESILTLKSALNPDLATAPPADPTLKLSQCQKTTVMPRPTGGWASSSTSRIKVATKAPRTTPGPRNDTTLRGSFPPVRALTKNPAVGSPSTTAQRTRVKLGFIGRSLAHLAQLVDVQAATAAIHPGDQGQAHHYLTGRHRDHDQGEDLARHGVGVAGVGDQCQDAGEKPSHRAVRRCRDR